MATTAYSVCVVCALQFDGLVFLYASLCSQCMITDAFGSCADGYHQSSVQCQLCLVFVDL